MSCLFNSYDPYFKQPFGAVRAGQSVHLTLCIPEELGYVDPHLVIQKEGKYDVPVHYRMKFDGQTPKQNHFSVDVTLNDVGLYFYYFDLYTDFRRIVRGPDNCGVVSWQDGEKWQITVYEADFRTPETFKGKVFYQIFPDRFCEGVENKPMPFPDRLYQADKHAEPFWQPNETGGHLNEDYFGGDLKGIAEKLPYIAKLGVTAIYLNPIFEAHSNHRYDTGDYEKIDPMLGDAEDLKYLCSQAKKLGIGVILDGVFSHTGRDSKYFNYYGHYPTVGAYNSPDSPYFSWYQFGKDRDDYKSWWGIRLLPEIREEEPSYRDYICGENGILRRWMRCGISGWRLDVADELPDVFLDDLRRAVKREDPDAIIIGEVWEDATTKFAYGRRRRYLLGNQLDSVMNYPFAAAILRFVRYGGGQAFLDAILSITEHYPPQVTAVLMNHIGTHDTLRAITALAGPDCTGQGRAWQHRNNTLSGADYARGVQLLKLASFLQYTLPGVPSLYYGDEVGVQGMKDPFNRGCMPWAHQDRDLLHWYQRLGQMRRGCKALAQGEFVPVQGDLGGVCYERQSDGARLLAAVNRTSEPKTFAVDPVWDNAYAFFDDTCTDGRLTVPPMSAALRTRQ